MHASILFSSFTFFLQHNLRLVLFVIKKYYQSFATVSTFHDLCQAGVKGLILAIDRFEQKKGFCLSTYGLYWIRHTIIRSITVSSFIRVPFGIESVCRHLSFQISRPYVIYLHLQKKNVMQLCRSDRKLKKPNSS